MFFMEHMDRENALIVSIKTISEILEWSEPTVYRQIKVLKEKNLITIAKSGTSNIYFINSQVAWTTYGNKKNMLNSMLVFLSQNQNKSIELEQVNLSNLIC